MEINITDKLDKRDEAELTNHLADYNFSKADYTKPKDLGVFLRDDNEKIIGGLVGHTWGNWFFIKTLWVHEDYRRDGLGSRILTMAEDKAVERGCKYAFIDTFSFQAPDFYPKMGYKEIFILDDCPLSGTLIYFTKSLPQ